MYTALDVRASALSHAFLAEAKRLFTTERINDSLNTATAIQFFSLGCVTQGQDKLSLELLNEGRLMAERMGLFGVSEGDLAIRDSLGALSEKQKRVIAHTAWGIHNWLT